MAAYPGNTNGPMGAALPVDPNWTSSTGKYMMMNHRPIDKFNSTTTGLPLFPYPADQYGDVKNWETLPGGNDSIWMDPGKSIVTTRSGKSYKKLVAPLIVPLDGRVNLSVHGNVLAANNSHAGNHGFGPYEVNLSKVLNIDNPAARSSGPISSSAIRQ